MNKIGNVCLIVNLKNKIKNNFIKHCNHQKFVDNLRQFCFNLNINEENCMKKYHALSNRQF